MNRMPAEKEFPVKGGNSDPAGVKVTESGAQKCKIAFGGEKGEVGIPAEFSGSPRLLLRLVQTKKNGNVFKYEQWFNNTAYGYGGAKPYPYTPVYYPGWYYWGVPTIWPNAVNNVLSVSC